MFFEGAAYARGVSLPTNPFSRNLVCGTLYDGQYLIHQCSLFVGFVIPSMFHSMFDSLDHHHWTKQLLCSQLLYITSVVPAILPSISAFATSVQPVPLGLEDQEEIHSVMIDPDHHQ